MATSGIDAAITAIQTIAAGVSGINSAPTALSSYPTNITTADLPVALTWVGQGQTRAVTSSTSRIRETERIYYTAVYIEPVGQNTSPARLANASSMLQDFVDALMTGRTLADGYLIIDELFDSGITTGEDIVTTSAQWLYMNGQAFTGFVLEMRTTEVHRA